MIATADAGAVDDQNKRVLHLRLQSSASIRVHPRPSAVAILRLHYNVSSSSYSMEGR